MDYPHAPITPQLPDTHGPPVPRRPSYEPPQHPVATADEGLRPRAAGQPGREVGGEESGRRPRAGGGAPELVDVRLHMPRPDLVVVRVSGTVDGVTAPVVAQRVGWQLRRAPHVVVDLSGVRVLGPQGLTVLFGLHRQAIACGVELHIVGAEHDAVRGPLHAGGLAQLVVFESTVDAVIAGLPWRGHVPRQRFPYQS